MNDSQQQLADLSPERRRLLELLQRRSQPSEPVRIRPLPRVSGENSFPLSFAQQRLWFIDRFQPGSTAYTLLSALRLAGPLDVQALGRAIDALVARHEVLRTTIVAVQGQPVQRIAPALSIPLSITDRSDLPVAEHEAAIGQWVQSEAEQPFDLEHGPLLRAGLLRLGPQLHVLTLALHHSIADGWSQGVLIRELTALYRGFAGGQPATLPELPIQYADFAVWQRQWLQGPVLERQLNYWRQQLGPEGTPLPKLQLPVDHPRAAVQAITGARQMHTLSPELTAGLHALSRQEGATLFMTLLAAFQVVLQRYSGQHDFAVGAGIANRNRPEIEGLIGFFVNTLVLRANLRGNPTFRALLRQVRETTLAAYAHQDLPFEKLVEELQPERDLSAAPFFQVSFVMQNTPLPALRLPPLTVELLETEHVTTKLDLSLSVVETHQGLRLRLQYNAELFESATIARLLEHFERVLAQVVADADRPVGALQLLSAAEQHQLLVEWNATQRPYAAESLHQIFSRRAAERPDAVALVYGDTELTYAELDRRANQLAHYLRAQGVEPELRVGLACRRSPDLIVGLLGILKAGGAYVPLDPNYPSARLQFMLQDAQIGVLVTQESLLGIIPASNAVTICLDRDAELIAWQPVIAPAVDVAPDNLAYIIYTSGSTGRPKGVLVPHRGLGNLAQSQQQALDLRADSRILQFASISFDAAVSEVCLALLTGATLVLAPDAALRPGPDLLHLLQRQAITTVTLPPSALAVLPHTELPRLEQLIVAGEACGADLVARWASGRRMFNGYGPTETTVCATMGLLDGTERIPPLGSPIANTRIYLLSPQLQPVPVGVPGEVYIGGVGVARGYHNRPELTAEKFVPDLFSSEPGSRLYRTGDLARYLPDGRLEFIGRIDDQVKLRGFRIELGEIEAVLGLHPQVREAVVMVREDEPGDQRLVAYVTSQPDLAEDNGQLVLDSEQVDQWQRLYDESYARQASPDPRFNSEGWGSSYTGQPIPAPEMAAWVGHTVERILALRPRRVLEIGCGSGLLLFRVAPVCEHYLGTDFSAAAIRSLRHTLGRPEYALPQVALAERTADQLGDLLTQRFDTVVLNSVTQYFPSVSYLLQVVENALRAVSEGGRIFVGDVRSLPLLSAFHASVQLFRAADEGACAEVWAQVQHALANEEQLAIDPRFWTALPQQFPQITAVEVLPKRGQAQNELTRFRYDVVLHVGGAALQPIDHTWLDWQGDELSLARLRERLSAGLPQRLGVLGVPNARVLADVRALQQLSAESRPATAHELRAGLEPAGVDPEDLWALSALGYQVTLSWARGADDGRFDVLLQPADDPAPADFPLAQTERRPWSAYTNNPLHQRQARSLSPQLRSYLQERLPEYMVPAVVVVLDAMPLTPNGKVDRKALPAPDGSRRQLAEAFVSPRTPLEAQIAGVWAEVLKIERVGIHDNFFALGGHSLLATQVVTRLSQLREREVSVRLLFEAPTVAGLAAQLEPEPIATALPVELSAEAQQAITEAEQRLLAEWNATAAAYPQDQCLHELIAAQAERTPAAIALRCGDERLTYGELQARANQLARHLLTLGVTPDTRVGLCVERSLDLVVGLLGILSAGAAYVPLDPEYPQERLAFMVADAQLPVLVTQEALLATLPASHAVTVCLDRDAELIARQPPTQPQTGVQPQHLAYVIYTSGSTGRPKGVLVEHRQVVNTLWGSQTTFGYRSTDVQPWLASAAFDITLFELVNPLLAGGTTLVLRREEILDAALLSTALQNCTTVHAVPTLLRQVVGQPDASYPRLRRVFVGGEAVPADLLHTLGQVCPNAEVTVLYGPTEATIICTRYAVARNVAVTGHPIGRPLPNHQLRVVDAQGALVPLGVVGELYVGGAGVTRGYLNRPELTAEKFVLLDDQRWYRTGDRARWRADGVLEFLGRTDDQVKLRGFRIELGEIEMNLRLHEAIRDAVVIVREDRPGDQRLVAYVVGEQTNKGTKEQSTADLPSPTGVGEGTAQSARGEGLASALRSHLSARLPEYMLPSAFVVLDALPVTPNGKLDRNALPAPDRSESRPAESFVSPRTPLEVQIAGVWAEVLGIEPSGIHDNFFALGGHSLLATQVITRLRQLTGHNVSLGLLFESPTIAEFAAALADQELVETRPILLAPRDGTALPLSFAQQRLWFLDQLQPGSIAHNLPLILRLQGTLDRVALERSINAIVERHEVLRTTFVPASPDAEAQVVQAIVDQAALRLSVIDVRPGAGAAQPPALEALVRAELERPFDLRQGPLLRATLLRLSATEHVLMVVLHHSIFDGWSERVLLRELTALYRDFAAGVPGSLPALPIQYADYALWQRNWLSGQVLHQQLGYWRRQLADLTLLELPTDHARPAVWSGRGASAAVHLPASLTTALRQVSQELESTLFMTLLAAWQVLLSRYSQQRDIVVGTPIAGRTRPELEPLIGFFVNTLVLRADLSGTPSFAEVVTRVRHTALEAYAHQDVPFELVVEQLQPERDLSRHPLFQVMFALHNLPPSNPALPGLTVTPMTLESRTVQFDLELILNETADGLQGRVDYSSDIFDAATIERIVAHYSALLTAIAAHPRQSIDQIELLTSAERDQLLAWNATAAAYPQDQCLHELIAAQAERTPAAIALRCGDERLTYGELQARANQLARHLLTLGVMPDTRVGLCVERSLDLVVGLLGILTAGAAYVPLDPDYPQERLAFMVADAQLPVLVTQASLLATLPASHAVSVCLDRDATTIARQPPTRPQTGVQPHHLAYVIYTSGSTGRPKGVLVEHRQVVNTLWGSQTTFGYRSTDVQPWLASVAFDITLFELVNPLLAGGTTLVLRREEILDAALLSRALQECTTVHAVPTLLRQVVGQPDASYPRLRRVFVGGEAVPADLLHTLGQVCPNAEVTVLYGPTEATIICTRYAVARNVAVTGHPIGRPLPNHQLRVVDAQGALVPLGVVGELYVGGSGVTRGYLNRPELTTEKFVTLDGQRWYRTGDRARWRADGVLEFLGRTDDQVKLRGFRIELGEIDAVLMQHPGVRDAVVIVREDRPGDQRLVAYVVGEQTNKQTKEQNEDQNQEPRAGDVTALLVAPDTSPSPTAVGEGESERSEAGVRATTEGLSSALRVFVEERLPAYMIPSAFVVLDALPVTPNGKLDRKALPAPDLSRSSTDESFVAARTPLEEQIASVWAEVLKIERVSVHDNFFALGGHSLLATQVITRLRHQLGRDIPLRLLFAEPTVAAFAERLAEESQAIQEEQVQPILRDAAPIPLSFGQQRLWFFDQLQPDSTLYSIPASVRIRGPLDITALQQSLSTVVRRHEVLRTSFEYDPAAEVPTPYQQIAPPSEITLTPVILPADAGEAAIQQLVHADMMRPFDLRRGPLLRMTLYQVGPDDHILALVIHHSIFDGWSQSILLRELITLYQGFATGRPANLPALPIQYADYALWQRNWLQGEVLAAQLGYWRKQLADAPVLELPTDYPRPPVVTYHGEGIRFQVPAALTGALRQLSQRLNSSLYMTLLAVFQALRYRYSGQSDLVVGTPIAGRTRPEFEPLIGLFANTLVLRTDLSGREPSECSFEELVQRVRAVCLDGYAHQDIPFEMLVEELHPERDLSYHPLFQVMFVLQNAPTTSLSVAGLSFQPIAPELHAAKVDLSVSFVENAGQLDGHIGFRADLFAPATMERLAQHFLTLLSAAVADPQQSIAAVPLLTEAERRRVLIDWNLPATNIAPDAAVHELIAAQAARTPDAVAVIGGDRSLTYRELNERANQLAHYLRAQGVGAAPGESRVGLCMERSPDLIVGLLGILKAGAAYVPLDPDYPQERLQFMVEDARIAVLVTQESLLGVVALSSGVTICVDRDATTIARQPVTTPDLHVGPGNLAYVIYTSGSTGRPKGVMIDHRALAGYVAAAQQRYVLTADDRMLQFASITFDASVEEIYTSLTGGATLVLRNDEMLSSPAAFFETCREWRISVLSLPTAFWHLLAESVADANLPLPDALRLVIIGGERVVPARVAQWQSRLGDRCELINTYGPTETTVVATAYAVPALVASIDQEIPIGRPLAHLRAYVLDPRMQPVPIGGQGELYIGGAGVARGYLRRPALTADRFVPDPFSGEIGTRLYRTGDLARYRVDGTIEFLGRIDQQIKLRGFRVEPGEIEAALRQHPLVRDAIIHLFEERPGEKRLVAYVVGEQRNKGTKEQENQELRACLTIKSYVLIGIAGSRQSTHHDLNGG